MDLALIVEILDGPGVLHALTGVIFSHQANIAYVDITDRRDGQASVYFELEDVADPTTLEQELRAVDAVSALQRTDRFARIYGKRIIVIGGGAQVGQVAVGAISEADRHNIR